jgi:perosamine synthetase
MDCSEEPRRGSWFPPGPSGLVKRRIALLGGTSTLPDCLLAARYIANPRRRIDGPSIARYEHAIARRINVRHAYTFSAGRVALYSILRALRVGLDDEVLLQVPTHIVVANAIRYTGAKPVYIDCRLDTYNMDLERAERAINRRTKAIILQHTFGIPADLDAALALQRRHGLYLIEDCVHALGARYDGRPVGGFGNAAFFSTEETKTISSTMGGVAVTDDPNLAYRIKQFQAACARPQDSLVSRYLLKFILYYFLTEPRLYNYTRQIYDALGRRQPLPGPTTIDERKGAMPARYEARLSNAQAALANNQLRRLEHNLAHRRIIADAYKEELSASGYRFAETAPKSEPVYVRYPVWVKDRSAALSRAARHAVLGTWFTSVLEEAVSPDCGDYTMESCPNAESAAIHLINLPTHPRVKMEDVKRIVSAVAETEIVDVSQPAGVPPLESLELNHGPAHSNRSIM